MKKSLLLVTFVGGLALAGAGYAHDHDDHGSSHNDSHGSHDMGHGSGESFLVKKQVDGYQVSFHVMKANPGMKHSGSHNLMIKVEEAGKALQNLKINSKVVYPDGDAETKALMKMGEWYMAGYELGHAGKYQLMILFKTADGKKHKAGVYYND